MSIEVMGELTTFAWGALSLLAKLTTFHMMSTQLDG